MSFPRYPMYKDSGVEWLGEVPEGWQGVPVKHLGRLKGGAGFPHEEQGVEGAELSFHKVSALGQAGPDGQLLPSENTISRETAKRLGAFVFPAKTIVFAKVGAALLLGRIRLLSDEACLDNNMMGIVVHRDACCVEFLRHAMTLVRFDLIANPGAVPSLNEGQIGDFRLPIPPMEQQLCIAEFLDRETAQIDELVAEQQRLMELLKEKRQAVISHAVTKGLNPRAPMKPSGIEWLGDVPAHWECVRNKVVFEHVDERSDTAEGELMTVSHITGVTPRSEKEVNMFLAETLSGYKKCRPGDLVINTMWAWMGALGCSPCDGLVSPSYNVYRPRKLDTISPAYYDYLCRIPSHKVVIQANSTGIWESRLRLYPDTFLSMRLAVPPLDEQRAIVEYLDVATGKFDVLTVEAERGIDLLQERRTALISAAVTGQIDVRQLSQGRAA